MQSPSPAWRSFPAPRGFPAGVSCWISDAEDDPVWDAFLLGSPLGQFQQSSAWARVKRLEGWRATRFIATAQDRILGGFQVLSKTKYRVGFGFVNKGPVLAGHAGLAMAGALQMVKDAARRLRLRAVIVQPPDLAVDSETVMAGAGLLENRIQRVIDATVLVDLARPWEAIEGDFSHSVRHDVRKICASGVEVAFDGPAGADRFFDLMRQSCARQRVEPNPSDPASIRAILTEFQPRHPKSSGSSARLLIARQGGETTAAILLVQFGQRLSLWKKGASAADGVLQPTKLLDVEAIRWGHSLGCRHYDLVGIDRPAAEELSQGRPRKEVRMKSSDFYKLLFGGKAVLLPRSRVWVRGLCPRLAYRLALALRRR